MKPPARSGGGRRGHSLRSSAGPGAALRPFTRSAQATLTEERDPCGSIGSMSRRSTAAFVIVAAADTCLAVTGRTGPRRLTKPLLMPLLMAGRDRPTQVALSLGGLGDV